MKILLIHYRYYIEGGPERYMFNITDVLQKKGHTIIPFSINYPNSVKTDYLKYFATPIVNEFHLSKAKTGIIKKMKIAKNFVFNKHSKMKLKQLILDTKPDIAYILIYSGKLTYSVLEACKELSIPIIHRISEFYHYCVRSSFFRDGKICTECLNTPKSCIRHKCVHGSKLKSILSYYAEYKEKKSGIRNSISHIICPSKFTQNIYQTNNIFPNATIHHVPTLFNFNKLEKLNHEKILSRKKNSQVCYIGRICQEKGIDTIVDAWKKIENSNDSLKLVLTGFFDDPYCNYIKNKINMLELKRVQCFDFLSKDKTFEIINDSFISLIPSIWYDNMPNSFIESQAYGIPVIASDIGSLTELVQSGSNGYLFKPDSVDDLVDSIMKINNMDADRYIKLSENSFAFIQNYCSEEKHYNSLIGIFNQALLHK